MRRQIGTVFAAGLLTWAVALAPGIANAAISSLPATTPQLNNDHRVDAKKNPIYDQVRQMVECNGTMYAVGNFQHVKNGNSSALIARSNAFAFSATSPYQVTGWNPNVNGEVHSVACAPDGQIIIAGNFSQVGTTAVRNMAKVDPLTGAVNPAFLWNLNPTNSNSPSGQINHIEVVQGHLLVGGNFPPTKINATSSTPGYLASVNPLTGRADGYRMPVLSGTYRYSLMPSGPATKVYNMAVSPDGQSVIVTGVFTSVDGVHHEQLFRLDMGATGATANGWAPSDMYTHCSLSEPFYAQDAAWSPDGTKIYVVTTGYKPYNATAGATPRTGPCDSAIAYDATLTGPFNGRIWQNYTGCDSLYSVGADASTVYIAGHERYIDNPTVCDQLGKGGRAQPGLGELNPTTGHSVPGPSRGRGLGADDVLVTPSGVWISSDDQANTDSCGGIHNHTGVCFLPYQ
jgi:hypothetical protein